MAAVSLAVVAARRRLIVVALMLAACADARTNARTDAQDAPDAHSDSIRLEVVASGLDQPLHVQSPPGDSRLFIVEQPGRIRVVRDGAVLQRPFIDLTDRVQGGGERGLLSVAFHPSYRSNGRFFVNYTDSAGDTRVVEFRAGPDDDTASAAAVREWLRVGQPFANHNGGHILFGPDGRLYIGMGDGGAAGDPAGNAQNRRSLLGKLLALDVDGPAPARPVIHALGLRNPWRMAFDSGLLYIADVGQGKWEEVNVARADSAGINYGWRTMEGAHCFLIPVCAKSGLHPPVLEYSHDEGCSITGGVVYRGRAIPGLAGHYFYSDWCEGWLRSFRIDPTGAADRRQWRVARVPSVTSVSADAFGEVYVVSGSGTVYRLAPAR